jgi:hypothetical protein
MLDSIGKPERDVHEKVDRQTPAFGERLQRTAESDIGDDCGVDTTGQAAQLVDGLVELIDRILQQSGHGRVELLAGDQPKREGQSDQTLLRSVVQIALDPSAFPVGRLHDAGPGRLHVVQPATQPAPHPCRHGRRRDEPHHTRRPPYSDAAGHCRG